MGKVRLAVAIRSSSYKDKIMYLDTWQIIRVKVSFISICTVFRGRSTKKIVVSQNPSVPGTLNWDRSVYDVIIIN